MSDMTNDYDEDDREDQIDEEEAKAAQKGGEDDGESISDDELAEAETLTVAAKHQIREQLEDEVAAFLARGGKITQVPADESIKD